MIGNFKEVAEAVRNRFADSPLGKQLGEMDTKAVDKIDDSSLAVYARDVTDEDSEKRKEQSDNTPETDNPKKNTPIQNKMDGLEREKEVAEELQKKYPPEEGYEIIPEAYLRDKDGNIVRDPETGEARRVDFVVVKDGKVVDSVEVTSKTADKTEQSAKENRIRETGGNYVRDSAGNLVEMPADVKTRIERRE
jgi:hypothetical protein